MFFGLSSVLNSTYRGSRKNAVVYLKISLLDCLTTKKIPGLFSNPRTFKDSPGLVGAMSLYSGIFYVASDQGNSLRKIYRLHLNDKLINFLLLASKMIYSLKKT